MRNSFLLGPRLPTMGWQELGRHQHSPVSARKSSSNSSKAIPTAPSSTGRVYNDDQMPPYALPDNMTRSTFMTRSTKGGGSANYNELRFEDKKKAANKSSSTPKKEHGPPRRKKTHANMSAKTAA